jgi:hypothetical protein
MSSPRGDDLEANYLAAVSWISASGNPARP